MVSKRFFSLLYLGHERVAVVVIPDSVIGDVNDLLLETLDRHKFGVSDLILFLKLVVLIL